MATQKNTLTAARLRHLLDYHKDTGIFRWRRSVGRAAEGSVAGSPDRYGYIKIGISGKMYRAHRLAFLWMDGRFPDDEVDHINRNRSDNRWENLRPACRSTNTRNAKREGGKGWYFDPRSKDAPYKARIYKDGKAISLGSFPTQKQAERAYALAKKRIHPEFSG